MRKTMKATVPLSLAATVLLAVGLGLVQQAHSQSALLNLLQAREQEVEQIAARVSSLYEDANCGSAYCPSDIAACKSQLSTSTCATSFGGCRSKSNNRRLDFASSVIGTANTPFDKEARTEACWSRSLDSTFIDINGAADENLLTTTKWQYFGTPSGFYRRYPGVPQQNCNSLDPRVRPWYVAATSGPKDIVLVIDRSRSMDSNGKWETALQAADTVLETLTIADYIAVVVFDSSASQVCGGDIPCGTLTQATASNIEAIRTQLQKYTLREGSNFEAAFQLAFSVLEQTGEFTSNCHSSILFMTDGEITVGKSGNSFLSYVDTLQDDLFAEAGKRAVLFTFSFGTGADETIPKALACAHNGTWSPVEYNANLRQQMGNYYDYFASLRASNDTPVVWVEPYEDASGAGILTTASKAVYDSRFSPPRLVGVIGIDILSSDLEDVAADYNQLLSALVQRSNTCPVLALDRCELSVIRTTDYSTSGLPSQYSETDRLCEPDERDGCNITTRLPCASDGNIYTAPSISATEETDPHFGTQRSSYNSEACNSCSVSTSSAALPSATSTATAVIAVVSLAAAALVAA